MQKQLNFRKRKKFRRRLRKRKSAWQQVTFMRILRNGYGNIWETCFSSGRVPPGMTDAPSVWYAVPA